MMQNLGHGPEKYAALNLTDIIKKHQKFSPLRATHAAAQESLFAADALKEAEEILRRKET
jgi:hypothetical protein